MQNDKVILTPEALALYERTDGDGRSFRDLIGMKALEALSRATGKPLAVENLPFGVDDTVPAEHLDKRGFAECALRACGRTYRPRWRNWVNDDGSLRQWNGGALKVGSFVILRAHETRRLTIHGFCDGCLGEIVRRFNFSESGELVRRDALLWSWTHADARAEAERENRENLWAAEAVRIRLLGLAELQEVALDPAKMGAAASVFFGRHIPDAPRREARPAARRRERGYTFGDNPEIQKALKAVERELAPAAVPQDGDGAAPAPSAK